VPRISTPIVCPTCDHRSDEISDLNRQPITAGVEEFTCADCETIVFWFDPDGGIIYTREDVFERDS